LKNPTSKLNILQFQVFQHHAYDPSIIESGASSHIFYKCSSFSIIFCPKIPHLDIIANGYKVAYQGMGYLVLYLGNQFETVLEHFLTLKISTSVKNTFWNCTTDSMALRS